MSNNKQQTALDLMFHRAISVLPMGAIDARQRLIETYQHAKEIHRTEIIESYASGSNDRLKNTINTNYYAETFGGNNEQQ